jgi:hypothetical protein
MGVSPSQIQAAKAAQASTAARAGIATRGRKNGATAPVAEGASAGGDPAPAGRPAQPRRKSTSKTRKKRR